ncbi:MAG: radical SAM protein [bacterium]|nr:radical SAM protein [bacterium]
MSPDPVRRKVLLLVPPSRIIYQNDNYCSFSSKASYYAPPLDLLVMSGHLHARHDLAVLDARAERMGEGEALAAAVRAAPSHVLFVTGYASWKKDLAFVGRLRETAGCRTLASGGFLLFHGAAVMERYPALDAVSLDFTSPLIENWVSDGEQPVADHLTRAGGAVLAPGRRPAAREFEIPLPRHELFPLRRYSLPYARRFPFSRVMGSMGCPHRCAFCSHASVPFRQRRIGNIMEELRHLVSLGLRQVYFTDPTFVIGRDRTMTLCREVAGAGLDISWSCNTRVDTLDRELLGEMRRAGCHMLQLGVESASLRVLRRAEKRIEPDRIRDAFRMCREAGIQTMAYFILGLPGDTRESVMETIAFSRELDADYASFTIATPDFGTRLREEAIGKGWIGKDLDVFDSTGYPPINLPGLPAEDLWRLRNRANRAFYLRPRYLARAVARARSPRRLLLLARNGVSLLRNMRKRTPD